jgi:hypothetical protein
LVDQGQMIDGDPVGYACVDIATHQVAFAVHDVEAGDMEVLADLCPRCHALWRDGTGRVTLRPSRERTVTLAPLPPLPVTLEQRQAECRSASEAAALATVRACAAWLRKADLTSGRVWHVDDVEGWTTLAQEVGDRMEQAMLASVRWSYQEKLSGGR